MRKQSTQSPEDVKQSRQPWLSPLQTLAANTPPPPPLRCSHTPESGFHCSRKLRLTHTKKTNKKKTWPWLLKPVSLFLLLWWKFYACHARGGKNVHFLARLFTEIDFTLSGMLDKQHLGLQLSAPENYCLQLMRMTACSSCGHSVPAYVCEYACLKNVYTRLRWFAGV